MEGIPEDLFINPHSIPQRLFCSICLNICREAMITPCEHLFCNSCLDAYIKSCDDISKLTCPNCREKFTQPQISIANLARETIENSMVYCSEFPECRCGWTGKYSMWSTHKEKYCPKASEEEKFSAKFIKTTGIRNLTQEELESMSNQRLKSILRDYIRLHRHDTGIVNTYHPKNFLEKHELILAILSIYHSPSSSLSPDPYLSTTDITNTNTNSNSNSNTNTNTNTNINTNINNATTTADPSNIPQNQFQHMTVKDLISYCKQKNIDYKRELKGAIEKDELLQLIQKFEGENMIPQENSTIRNEGTEIKSEEEREERIRQGTLLNSSTYYTNVYNGNNKERIRSDNNHTITSNNDHSNINRLDETRREEKKEESDRIVLHSYPSTIIQDNVNMNEIRQFIDNQQKDHRSTTSTATTTTSTTKNKTEATTKTPNGQRIIADDDDEQASTKCQCLIQ